MLRMCKRINSELQEPMDHSIYHVSPDHGRRRQHELQQGSTRLISSCSNKLNEKLQNLHHDPYSIQIAEKRLEQLLISIDKSKQSRVALVRFESENRNDSCCCIDKRNLGLKKRSRGAVLIDSPTTTTRGGLEKRHKKESSSSWPHSSREKKLLPTPPISPQTVWNNRTLDRVVQNKFDEIDMDITNNLFFEVESQDNSLSDHDDLTLNWIATNCSPIE